MTDVRQIGTLARDERLEDAMRRLDAYRVERTLAEKPGLLTELATRTDPDGSTTQVVLKHIALELANPLLWKRYRLADTSHLPELVEVIELPDEYVVVLQYIAGMSLAAYVERMGVAKPSRARSIMDDLCDAASALSSVGIIHRDIKPSNVILSSKGAYLIDPGIARISDSHSYQEPHDHDTMILGTYGYASPEQLGYAQTDARSDVFSLARVLGYMLTGISPTEPAFLNALRGDRRIPDGLRLIISRACSLEPSLRPANAQALKRQIDANVSSKDTDFHFDVSTHTDGGAMGKPDATPVRPAKTDVDRPEVIEPQTLAEWLEPVATPPSGIPMPDVASPAPQENSPTTLDSDGREDDDVPSDSAVVLEKPMSAHHGTAPTPPKGLSLAVGSNGREVDVRPGPDEVPRHGTPIYESVVAEPYAQEVSDTQRVAIRLVGGFLGFFGTVFIIASFSLGDTSLPGWGNICFGLAIGIFWNYLPAYELIQFFRSAGRYRRTGLPRPNVFKRTFMWFGIGFAILAVVSGLVHATGYQGPQ